MFGLKLERFIKHQIDRIYNKNILIFVFRVMLIFVQCMIFLMIFIVLVILH